MRKRLVVALVTLLALSLSACADIPYSGSVHAGVAGQTVANDDLQFLPSGPTKGATTEQILSGFVDAATSAQNDWGVAREFLTAEAQKQWKPSHQVVIDDGNRSIRRVSETSYVVDTQVQGVLDEQGVYTAAAPTAKHLFFTFAKEGNEWRISSAPAGIVIDAHVFVQTYAEIPLYFYSPTSGSLVPDVRWFPARSSTATRVVKALLAGPVSWMSAAHAVESAFPAGAVLVADSVPVESGVASADFEATTLRENQPARARMLAQLAASLSAVPGVSSARMTVSGTLQMSADVPSQNALQAQGSLSEPIVLDKSGLQGVGANGSTALTLLGAPMIALAPSVVSVSADRANAIILASTGVYGINAGGGAKLIDGRRGQIAPNLDAFKFVWTAVSSAPSQLHASKLGGAQTSVAVPWMNAEALIALSVSPDGTRLASIYQSGGRDILCVAGITRNASQVPVSVGPCLLPYRAQLPIDSVGWVDASHVAVSSPSEGNSIVSVMSLGGLTEHTTIVGHVKTITGTGSYKIARVATSSGEVLQQLSPSRWYSVAHGVGALATVN